MEQITITMHSYSGPPGKIFKGPRTVTEAAFLDYMNDNPDAVEDGYIKVAYKHLSAISHNKVPILALNDCYKVLFFEPETNGEEVSEDDLEITEEEVINDEDPSDLEEEIDDSPDDEVIEEDDNNNSLEE